VFFHGFLKHNKTNYFLAFWILQHVCKTPKGISQYFKKYKNLILGEIHLLFTVNVWIKKSQRDEYPKYYWELLVIIHCYLDKETLSAKYPK
jgi:small-conductance mechanosensitive channel